MKISYILFSDNAYKQFFCSERMPLNVLVTGTGAVASAVVRALVPSGYDIKTVGIEKNGLTIFRELGENWNYSPEQVGKILEGGLEINPFLKLPTCEVPNYSHDLSKDGDFSREIFKGLDCIIL